VGGGGRIKDDRGRAGKKEGAKTYLENNERWRERGEIGRGQEQVRWESRKRWKMDKG
jgi:hypothetical protein